MSPPALRVLVVSSEFPDARHPVSAAFVRDQALIAATDCDVAVLVPRVAGWRQIATSDLRPGVHLANEAGLTVCRSIVWHPPLRPRWLARTLLQPPPDADDRPGVPNRIMDLLLASFLRAGERGLDALVRNWGQPDLIHGHFVLPGGWIAHRLARRLNRPLVLTEHSSRLEDQTATPLRRRLAVETYRGAAAVIAVSPFQARQLRDIEPAVRTRVIGNPIDTDFFSPATAPTRRQPEAPFRALTIAHLTSRKGVDVLLRAVRLLVERGCHGFHVTVGGDGPERSQLEALTAELELGDRVRFVGRMMPIEVRDALRQCDAFVLPSRRESFGVVLAEAMCCGKPVVATRCGGTEYVVTEDCGLLVPVDDAEALARAMDSLIRGRAQFDAQRIRDHAVGRFNQEAYRQALARVYREALP